MSCLSLEELIAVVDRSAAVDGDTARDNHLRTCARCTATATHLRRLSDGLARQPAAVPRSNLTARVMARLDSPAVHRTPLGAWLAPTFAAALATAAVFVVVTTRAPTERVDDSPILTARGSATTARPTIGFEARWHRPPTQEDEALTVGTPVWPGAVIPESAGFSFVIRNLTGTSRYAMLFAVDAAGEVHWFYPAYPQRAADPVAILLPAAPDFQNLGEAVAPQAPARGPLTLVGLFLSTPMRVTQLEALIAADGLNGLSAALPEAVMQTISTILAAEVSR